MRRDKRKYRWLSVVDTEGWAIFSAPPLFAELFQRPSGGGNRWLNVVLLVVSRAGVRIVTLNGKSRIMVLGIGSG